MLFPPKPTIENEAEKPGRVIQVMNVFSASKYLQFYLVNVGFMYSPSVQLIKCDARYCMDNIGLKGES